MATEDMLTPDLLSWTLGATVGINRWSSERNAKTDFEHCRVATEEGKAKYSKQFALNKQAQKVKYVATDIVAEETLEGSRISLANEDGTKLVSIYPKVSGSISDAQVQAEPENRWSSESRAKRLAA